MGERGIFKTQRRGDAEGWGGPLIVILILLLISHSVRASVRPEDLDYDYD